jgi:glycosyltransferase involved in cell wall biosynthesis
MILEMQPHTKMPATDVMDSDRSALGPADARAHVCFVAPTAANFFDALSVGGAEVQQVLLARALQSRSFAVSFVVNSRPPARSARIDGIDVLRCKFRYLGGSNLWFPIDTASLLRTLVRIRPDILVLKSPTTLLLPLVTAKRLTGSKLVKVMARDEECVRSAALLGPVSPMKALLLRLLYEDQLKHADAVVFQTEEQRALASRDFGINGPVIKNIIRQQDRLTVEKDMDVLWVGSCWPWKRPEIYLRMAKALPQIRFGMIASPGDEGECQQMIRDTAKTIPNLTYFGLVPYDEVCRYYSRAKLVVHTSDIEGFPNVFLQAWQAAVPVISRIIDPDRVIVTKRLGLVSGGEDQLRTDVIRLLRDDDLRLELGERGRAYVLANHSQSTVLNRYLGLFSELLQSDSVPSGDHGPAVSAAKHGDAR